MFALRSAVASAGARAAAVAAAARPFSSTAARHTRVAVLGASGGIGQPLSLLLRMNALVSRLALYDIVGTAGVAADLSHIDAPSEVVGFTADDDGLRKALEGAEVVVVPAGVPRKPGMTRDDLFNTNAGIVASLADAVARHCPEAQLLVISNPVNSTVPICAEVLKKRGVYDPRRLFGVTTLDVMRASRFVYEANAAPFGTRVAVVGGHSGATIIPLLSQISGAIYTEETRNALTHRIQFGGDEVVKAKDGKGSATLSMALAGARFMNSVLHAKNGTRRVVEPAYVESPIMKDKGISFFASEVELDRNGIDRIFPVGQIDEYEKALLDKCLPELKESIEKGVEFAKKWQPSQK
ncbi:MAG: lactate/malate dehydrogenase [Olpidium bornovanus]|uniref:Malate dehydrogenase n=1 Tax=Olpidium bornovanus TaxID=278681 RepID=A0A8H8A0S4_9FUNG|nr:MAG: lactate/malate dehydrogenase [Olpidium bornovanus]